MKFRDALIALSIGDIILVAVMIMTVYIGSKPDYSNVIDSVTVGRVGTYIFSAIICVTSGLVCHPVGLLWADLVSVYSDKRTDLAVLGGIMMASTAIKGFKGMEKLARSDSVASVYCFGIG